MGMLAVGSNRTPPSWGQVSSVTSADRAPILWLGPAVACSGLGMAVHTVREFGIPGVFAWETGLAPVIFVQVAIFVLWWHARSARPTLGLVLAATGLFLLVGGAILSVLPLPSCRSRRPRPSITISLTSSSASRRFRSSSSR